MGCKIVQTFQNTKKKPYPQKEKQVSNVSSTPYFHHRSPVWGLCKNPEIGDVIGCGIGDDLMDNFNDPRKTLKYQFSFFPHRFSTNFTTMQSFATKKKIG